MEGGIPVHNCCGKNEVSCSSLLASLCLYCIGSMTRNYASVASLLRDCCAYFSEVSQGNIFVFAFKSLEITFVVAYGVSSDGRTAAIMQALDHLILHYGFLLVNISFGNLFLWFLSGVFESSPDF